MKVFYFLPLSFALWILSLSHLHAGAWLREPGEVYSKLAYSRFESDQVYSAKNNKKLPGPDFEDDSVSLYTEYGLSKKWTGLFSLDAKSISATTSGVERTDSGLAHLRLWMKRAHRTERWIVSSQYGIKIPLGYNRLRNPPLGDGQVLLEGSLLIGKSLYPFPGYGNVEAGYRRRNGDVSDEFFYNFEAGVNLAKKVLFKVSLNVVETRADDTAASEPQANRHPNIFDEEFTNISPALLFFLPQGWGVELSTTDVIAGANTGAGQTIGLGVFWQGDLK